MTTSTADPLRIEELSASIGQADDLNRPIPAYSAFVVQETTEEQEGSASEDPRNIQHNWLAREVEATQEIV